jgi:hypothetical protein
MTGTWKCVLVVVPCVVSMLCSSFVMKDGRNAGHSRGESRMGAQQREWDARHAAYAGYVEGWEGDVL